MKKSALLITALLLTVSLGAAAEITPQNSDNVTLDPGGEVTQEFEITLEDNDTEVRADTTDTGDYDVSYNSGLTFEGSGTSTFSANIEAPDKSNYTSNVTFTFKVSKEGNLTDQEVTHDVKATTRIPYETLQGSTWINESYQLDFNGEKYNVSDITDSSLFLDNNSIQFGGTDPHQRTLNNVRFTLLDIIPGEYAEIKADTKEEDVTFDLEVISQPKKKEPQTCKLGIKTITTLRRGNSFAIETIDTNSDENDIVGGVSVTLIDSGKGEPIGNTQSGASGYASLYIPEQTKGPVVARLADPSNGCDSNNQRVSFNKPYNVYIEDNEEYQLSLQVQNQTVYGDITGQVTNAEGGTVGTGIIQVEKPNGQMTDTGFNKSGFGFDPSQAGDYKLKATKDGYVESDSVTVTYIADRDGDGVPNSQDQCPDTEGVQANDGCPKQEVYFSVFKDGQRYTDELRPNQGYTFKIMNDNQSVVDYDGKIPVEGADTEIQFQDGVSQQGDSSNVVFANTGSYGLSLNNSAYEPVEQNLQVAHKPVLEGVPLAPIGFGLLILLGLGGILWVAANSTGSSSTTNSEDEFKYNLDELGNGGGN